MRSDCGTETVMLVAQQLSFHDLFETTVPQDKCHQNVKSSRNKIEAVWSRYLKAIGHSIMAVLEDGFRSGIYNDRDLLEG